ncbi:MAG TPA: hypothetical protein VFO89_03445 [Thermoanaerobaculia bacterium]|nr:hypothetical protein [Thermoanaerobaculia bacterium]
MKPGFLLASLLAVSPLAAQLSPTPPDAIVPVVVSVRGPSNATFRTELQLGNAGETVKRGWLVLRPQLIATRYEIAPHATLSFADVAGELGGTGLGSLDILVESGGIPVIVARAFDDQPGGTTGVSVPAVRFGEILGRGDFGALIVPRDLARYRFNIGIRALDSGATLELTLRTPSGQQRHARDLVFAEHAFVQQIGDAFTGTTLQPNELLEIRIAAGSAILYATTVDNATNDSSIQVLRR